jgi:hypothetical protein
MSGREHVRPTSWPSSIPRPRTGSIDWPNLGKGTPTKGVARQFHEVLWRNAEATKFYSDCLLHDLHDKLHWIGRGGGGAKYAVLLLFYCFSNIMSSVCLRSHLVPASFVSLGVPDAYILVAPRNTTPYHHDDPRRSSFKFQTALLTVVGVISQAGVAVCCRETIEYVW